MLVNGALWDNQWENVSFTDMVAQGNGSINTAWCIYNTGDRPRSQHILEQPLSDNVQIQTRCLYPVDLVIWDMISTYGIAVLISHRSPNAGLMLYSTTAIYCLCPIHWSQLLSWEWRCSWSSADRRCSNYIWVINNFIAYWGASYIRDFTVVIFFSVSTATILKAYGKYTVQCFISKISKTKAISINPKYRHVIKAIKALRFI